MLLKPTPPQELFDSRPKLGKYGLNYHKTHSKGDVPVVVKIQVEVMRYVCNCRREQCLDRRFN